MAFLQQHQLDIMLIFCGVCGILAVLAAMTQSLTPTRRRSLVLIEVLAMVLLLSDRWAYLYRGGESAKGYWMVRVCNFLVFLLILLIIHCFDYYLMDLCTTEGRAPAPPKRLRLASALCFAGEAMVVLSQFTGLYYSFDESNYYHRGPGFLLCYTLPLAILLLQLTVILQYRNRLNGRLTFSLLLFSIVPLGASILQIFAYGLSLTDLSIVGMAILLYIFALQDMNEVVARANRLKLELLRQEQQHTQALFEETAEALASAIDAKDEYTHGHSARVADYSLRLARTAGLDGNTCEDVYFAALLHDVGKIGVADSIINKKGALTDEEFAAIKLHPVIGRQILSSIRQSPTLSDGAAYHHERYDGKGYPEGLAGEDIPEVARIIAVADAYDAMTSRRSYRDPIPQAKVREELIRGSGTQFDPRFARIMEEMIDQDPDYTMREIPAPAAQSQ